MMRATDHMVRLRSVYRSDGDRPPVHWFEAGDPEGEPVVLVHGFMAHAMTYRRAVPYLAEGYRLVIPDLPGHGRDQSFRESDVEPTIPSLCAWLRNFVHALDTPLHLVGHSLGATLIYSLARDETLPISSLTLVNPGFRIPASPVSRFILDNLPVRVATLGATRLGMMIYEPIQWCGPRMNVDEVEAYLEPLRQPDRLRFMMRLGSDLLADADRTHLLAPVPVPTCLIWGKRDHILPVEDAPRIRDMLGAELAMMDDCGHCPMEDCPEAFSDVFREFLYSTQRDTRVSA